MSSFPKVVLMRTLEPTPVVPEAVTGEVSAGSNGETVLAALTEKAMTLNPTLSFSVVPNVIVSSESDVEATAYQHCIIVVEEMTVPLKLQLRPDESDIVG